MARSQSGAQPAVELSTGAEARTVVAFDPDDPEAFTGLRLLMGLGRACTDRLSLLAEVKHVSAEIAAAPTAEARARRTMWLLFATGRAIDDLAQRLVLMFDLHDKATAFRAIEEGLYRTLRQDS
jgi:hypothetical protein